MNILVGLGNPGKRYEQTPHNVGFIVIDELARQLSCPLRTSFRFNALIGKAAFRDDRILLVQPATYMNNSGLAISAEIKLPANSDDNRVMMMPADASFRSIPVVAMPVTMANMAGLVAVHHGSRANYAADDLPVAAIGPGQGRLIYSYGIKPDGTHTHGFPTQEAMGKYDAAGWGMKRSTAQGNAITEGGQPTPYPLLLRGNMAIGGGPLAGEYANTAFGAFADRLD